MLPKVSYGSTPCTKKSSLAPFMSILAGISRLEENNTRADIELKDSSNDIVATFLENSQARLNVINEQALNVKVTPIEAVHNPI